MNLVFSHVQACLQLHLIDFAPLRSRRKPASRPVPQNTDLPQTSGQALEKAAHATRY